MADKQYTISLQMKMDNSQAKQAAKELQQTLNSLTSGANTKNLDLSKSIMPGIDAANRLKMALAEATNADTGKLDLTRFNQSLKQSGMSLEQYASKLSSLGPKGVEAFQQVTRAIINADKPVRTLSTGMQKLMTSFTNTIRWQISSRALYAFIGSIQTAYNYAKDLNASLNDIRIVTGQSTEQMAEFAVQANKAAKALSTSTLDYTKASLIYYQQGIRDQDEIKERTDVTIKMANVTSESAQEVSNNMTAVWNNFDDGSKSLEYYADVMTALGAATASSTAEISQGLEKFASIASTVGLSYEYATTALATVTAETRQSADVVGNAFKTLFARIQGLSLGETQEDGTDLNKYSDALMRVGVNIKDTNGEIKEMDTILNELGNKWSNLGKDQQIALAQTVAGVRQYTQLIALMDNWGTFQENLVTAQGSEGTLQNQADIYAESWEAAGKRVKAAAEELYEKLFDDEFFIDITNAVGDLVEFISDFTDSLGGVKGLLSGIAVLVLKIKGDILASGLNNLATGLKHTFVPGSLEKDANALKSQSLRLFQDQMTKMEVTGIDSHHTAGQKQAMLQKEYEFKGRMLELDTQLSGLDKLRLNSQFDYLRAQDELLLKESQEYEYAKRQLETAKQQQQVEQDKQNGTYRITSSEVSEERKKELEKYMRTVDNFHKNEKKWNDQRDKSFKQLMTNVDKAANSTMNWSQSLVSSLSIVSSISFGWQSISNSIKTLSKEDLTFSEAIGAIGSLSMGLTMILPTLGKMKTLGSAIGASFKNMAANKKLLNTFTANNNRLEEVGLAIRKIDSGLSKEALQEELTKNEYKALGITYDNVENVQDAQNLVLEKQQTLEEEKQVALAQMSNVYLAIALVALAAIVAIGVAIYRNQTKLKREMEQTAKQAKAVQENYEKLNESAKQVKSTIDSYQESRKNIDTLTEGTTEFKQAIVEANEQALKLIETYDGLLYTIDSSGLIKIDEGSLNTYYENQLAAVNREHAMSLLAKNTATEAKQAYEIDKAAKSFSIEGYLGNSAEAFKSIVNDINNLEDEEKDNPKIYEEIFKNRVNEFFNSEVTPDSGYKSGKNYFSDPSNYFKDLEKSNNSLDLAMEKSKEAIYQQVEKLDQNTQAIDKNTELAISLLSKDNDIIADSDYKGAHDALIAKQINDETIQEKISDLNWSTRAITRDEYLKHRFGPEAHKYKFKGNKLLYQESSLSGWEETGEKVTNADLQSNNLKEEFAKLILSNEYLNNNEWIAGNENSFIQAGQLLKDVLEVDEATASNLVQSLINGDELDLSVLGEYTKLTSGHLNELTNILKDTGINAGDQLSAAIINSFENSISSNLESSKNTFDQIGREEDKSLTLGVDQSSVLSSFKLTEEGFKEYKKELFDAKKEMSKFGDVSSKTYEQAAAEVLDLSGDIDLLANALDEQNEKLTSGNPELYAQGLQGIQESVRNLLGADVSLEFIEKNLENIKKAAYGDIEALNALRKKLSFEDVFGNLQAEAGTEAALVLDQFKQAFTDFDPGKIKLGASLDETGLTESLNRMIQLGLISAEEASRVLNETFGFTPEITKNRVSFEYGTPEFNNAVSAGFKMDYLNGSYIFEVPSINGKATLKTRDLYSGTTSKREESKGKKKTLDDELERYHELTETIEDLETAYDRMGKRKDRAYGQSKLDAIDAEIKALEKLIDKNKEYSEEIKKNLADDKLALKKYDAQFDEAGRIKDYDTWFEKWFNKLANASDEAWEAFKKAVEQYEESLNLFEQVNEEIEDQQNELIDRQLERIVTEVEIKIDVEDKELVWLEYMLKKIERQAFSTVEQMKNIMLQVDNQMARSKPIQEAIDKIYKQAEEQGRELTQAEQDQIQEYKESLLEINENLMELSETIENSLIDALEEFHDEIDRGLSRFDSYAESLEHFKNILELTGKSAEHVENLKLIGELLKNNADRYLRTTIGEYQNLLKTQEEIEKKIAESTGETKKYWEEQLEEVTIKTEEAYNAMLEAYEKAIEAAKEAFETTIDATIDKLKESIGALGLDEMRNAYARQKELSDLYLSDVEKTYELNKLNRELEKSMDSTDSIAGKQKLRDVMLEINELAAEGNNITQYDLDLARAKYDLALAEIALEEAQEAKSQVRMSRNASGAWSYVFTANESNVADAQQNYEDKLYALAQIGEKQVEALSENLLEYINQMFEELGEIDVTTQAGIEQYNTTFEFWANKIGFTAGELNKVLTDYGINYQDTLLGQQTLTGTVGEFVQKVLNDTATEIRNTMIPAGIELNTTIQDYSEETTRLIEEDMADIGQASEDLADDMEKSLDQMDDDIQEIIGVIDDWKDRYSDAIDDMIKKNEDYYDSTQDLIDKLEELAEVEERTKDTGPDNDSTESDDPEENDDEEIVWWYNGTPYTKAQATKMLNSYIANAREEIEKIKNGPGANTISGQAKIKEYQDKIKEYQRILDSFDTGGYTGDWAGADGKLAMLHQKEIVLNADDTKNFLAGITVLRAITEAIDLQAASAKLGLAGIQSSSIGNNGQVIQQDVTIHAEFPNATNHSEIEEAFNNLINRASQYVNRK